MKMKMKINEMKSLVFLSSTEKNLKLCKICDETLFWRQYIKLVQCHFGTKLILSQNTTEIPIHSNNLQDFGSK
jgi:hypothetical protein